MQEAIPTHQIFVLIITKYQIVKNNNYYRLHQKLVEDSGIEPLTSCVQGRRSPS